MELFTILYQAHSGLRWVVLLLVVLTLVIGLVAWMKGGTSGKLGRIIPKATVGMLDLMFLIGATMLATVWINLGEPGMFRIEHAVINLVAIGVAHVGAKNAPPVDGSRGKKLFLFFLVAVGLIVAAILRLPQGFGMTPADAIGF